MGWSATRSLENTPCGSRALVAAAGFIAALVLPTASAAEEDGYRHGRVRYVEPGVTLHRATEVSAEEALANLPFLPGDRVWTDASGRVEFQFPDGTLVRLDNRSKLDYAGHEEGRGRAHRATALVGQPDRARADEAGGALRDRDAGRLGRRCWTRRWSASTSRRERRA